MVAQAGGASPPFTACAHSRFEVVGVLGRGEEIEGGGARGGEGGDGAGGERGMSDRCGALDVA